MPSIEELRRLALNVLDNAYAPYSGVRVAAAIEAEDGSTYLGVNVENASLGLTICAERAAVAAMVTSGRRKVRKIVIVSNTPEPLPPCGACRQVLAEFSYPDTIVASFSAVSGKQIVWRFSELAPYMADIKELIDSKRARS